MKSDLLKKWGCLLTLALPLVARGQFAIDWFAIDNGAGTSTGGVYSVSGTIGQPDGGTMSGGGYSLDGGFWALVGVIQTPGAPLLTILHTPTNTVVVSWPSSSTGFSLQEASSVSQLVWTTPSETVNDNGTNKFIVGNLPTGNRFYRLARP